MKKAKNSPKPYQVNTTVPTVQEPYISAPKIKRLQAALADYPYTKFQRVASSVPFTLTEWANILHLSERTLQRYAKDNKNFEGIYVDRILQIEQMIHTGLEVFNDADALYSWLKKPKDVLGETIGFDALSHSHGINQVNEQLQRIQHGIYA